MFTALSTSVSSASFGGSHHFAASAAIFRTSARSTPGVNVGKSSCSIILFSVSVPVLSEHRMVMPASSSTEDRRATMAFSAASSWHPSASVVVHTTRSAMGMDATSSTTLNASTSQKSTPMVSR